MRLRRIADLCVMCMLETFVKAVEQCPDLPQAAREQARSAPAVESHSFDKSYLEFLDEQIRLNARGASWTERLKRRREGLQALCSRPLLRGTIHQGNDEYTVEVDPETTAVVYWERY